MLKKELWYCALLFNILIQGHTLVDVKKHIPTIVCDTKYATPNNFTKQIIYPQARCYLLAHVVHALNAVQKELKTQNLGLLIWDAYRPLSAQRKLWQVCPDPRYVEAPQKGGRHTRGTTVDVTLINLSDSTLLEMPTGFDDFSEKAASDYDGNTISDRAKQNRRLLQLIMKKHGFVPIKSEWWHFDFHDWQKYSPLDIDFNIINQEG